MSISCNATDASGIASNCAGISAPAVSFGLGTHTVTFSATDNAGNTATQSVTFTVGPVTPGALANLTAQYVRGSAHYAALAPLPKAIVDALLNTAVSAINRCGPNLTARQTAVFVKAYDAAVDALARGGWLTASQQATLKSLASSL